MSRRAQPIEVRKAKGNPQRRPLPDAPPRVAGAPPIPPGLSKAARAQWAYYCRLLARRGQLSVDTGPSLRLLSETTAEVLALRDEIERGGKFQTVTTKSGDRMERIRPAYRALMDASRRELALLTEFGLTDASRGKVTTGTAPNPVEPPKGEDPAEKYGLN